MRCHAKSRRSGEQCKSWSVKGKRVCRMHGAFAGIKTIEGRARQVDAVTTHGRYTKEAHRERADFRVLIKECRECLPDLKV